MLSNYRVFSKAIKFVGFVITANTTVDCNVNIWVMLSLMKPTTSASYFMYLLNFEFLIKTFSLSMTVA